MEAYYVKKVGQNRGAPRVWLEGSSTERAGLSVGQRYDIEVQGAMIVLQANKDGSRVVSGKVVGEKNNPIIDINSKALLAMFDGMAAIRVVVKKDAIFLMPLASEIKKRERFVRLREKLQNGEPVDIGSLSHGGGILSHAMHSGLKQSGVESRLAFANEIRGELLEHAAIHNDAWNSETQLLAAPMQELAFDSRGIASIPKCEILEMGLPCSGASQAGKSKRGLAHPEAHPHVGHLVVSALMILNRCNPAVAVLENVPQYAQSASADILRNQLRDMGYVTHERVLNGKEWGAHENRNRWCMIAVTEGLEFDFDQLMAPGAAHQLIAEVLDDIGPDDERWRTFDYLKTKEVRDAAKGSSFSMQIVSSGDDAVNTIRKGYAKGGSTDPLLRHPTNPDLLRQFTPAEHARIKQIPSSLIEGLSNQIAHEVLGQSIVYAPFKDVGAHVGNALNRFVGKDVIEMERPNNASEPARLDSPKQPVIPVIEHEAPASQGQLTFGDPIVSEGEYFGMVLSIASGIATQKINRDGRTAQHDVLALSAPVAEGDVVNIKYAGGVGTVSGKEMTVGLDR